MSPPPKRTGIQLAVPFSERRLKNIGRFPLRWAPPYLVQPKLNGERCRMLVKSGRSLLLSSTEDIIPAVPHINQASFHLPDGEYDGELYVHGLTWAEIHSIVSREVNLHERSSVMELHLFDLPWEDVSMHTRLIHLNEIAKSYSGPPCIKFVANHIATNLTDIMNLYSQFIDSGYEGFILRHLFTKYERKRSAGMMKFKPKQSDTYTITKAIEATSESGTPLGMVGAFECIDDMGTLFKVGAGRLDHSERVRLWQNYSSHDPEELDEVSGHLLLVEYQTLSDAKKVPLFSRAVRVLPLGE